MHREGIVAFHDTRLPRRKENCCSSQGQSQHIVRGMRLTYCLDPLDTDLPPFGPCLRHFSSITPATTARCVARVIQRQIRCKLEPVWARGCMGSLGVPVSFILGSRLEEEPAHYHSQSRQGAERKRPFPHTLSTRSLLSTAKKLNGQRLTTSHSAGFAFCFAMTTSR